jgi:hypothetical protein
VDIIVRSGESVQETKAGIGLIRPFEIGWLAEPSG